jgi:hypothetical protein
VIAVEAPGCRGAREDSVETDAEPSNEVRRDGSAAMTMDLFGGGLFANA